MSGARERPAVYHGVIGAVTVRPEASVAVDVLCCR